MKKRYYLHTKIKGVIGFYPRQKTFKMTEAAYKNLEIKQKLIVDKLIYDYGYSLQYLIL